MANGGVGGGSVAAACCCCCLLLLLHVVDVVAVADDGGSTWPANVDWSRKVANVATTVQKDQGARARVCVCV